MKGTIVYYGGFALPDKSASANRVASNGKLFEEIGYETVFLGADYENRFDGIKKLSDNMFSEAHPVSSKDWLKSIVTFKNLKTFVERYKDVKMVLLYNVPFITLVLAKRYFSKKGITVAYDCTEWSQFTEGSFLKRIFKFTDELFIRKFAHKVADKMIVISRMMENAYSSNKKLLRLPPLVDLKDDIWHQDVEGSENIFTFCFAGFPGGNKESLDKVVEAFSKISEENVALKIVGLTEADFLKLYPDMKQRYSKNTEFLGVQTHKASIKNILNCDCYVFIRMSDRRNNAGFPTKFAESFTCGVPIITTNVSDVKGYVSGLSDSIVIENADVKDIYDAMTEAFEKYNPQKPKNLRTDFYYAEYTDQAKKWLE